MGADQHAASIGPYRFSLARESLSSAPLSTCAQRRIDEPALVANVGALVATTLEFACLHCGLSTCFVLSSMREKKIYLRWLESGWARGSSGLTCHLGGQDDLLLSTLHSWTWVAARWCVGEKKRSFV